AYGRLAQTSYWVWTTHYGPNGTSYQSLDEITNQRVSYAYDANPFDSNYSQYTTGRLAAVLFHDTDTGQALSYQYSYNQARRVLKQRMTHDFTALDMTATYTYDNEGRMTSLAYPQNGPTYNYGFDAMGRLNAINPGTNPLATATYGVASEMIGLSYFGTSMN